MIDFNEGTRDISYSINNTLTVAVPVIPFNCLFDTDVGLLKLIENEYLEGGYFDNKFFEEHQSNISLVRDLYQRPELNPLLLCLKDKSLADDLYNQFIEQKYKDIIENSVYTGIFDLCSWNNIAEDMKITIVYTRQEELDFLNHNIELFKDFRINYLGDFISENISKTKQFFIKSVTKDIYLVNMCRYIMSSSVYILDYEFNFKDNNLINNEYTLCLDMNRCRIYAINAFDKRKLGLIKDEYTEEEENGS